jgi:hypothetical protein
LNACAESASSNQAVLPPALEALEAFVEADQLADECGEWKWENLEHAFKFARTVLATARSTTSASNAAQIVPILAVTVQGGLIDDMAATTPVDVVVEDWDVPDEDTGKKPTRNVWKLVDGLSQKRAVMLRRLIAND